MNGSRELADYSPEKRLKAIAVAEAAERYYAARDPEKLYDAIEVKLTGQRDFVRWWDGQEKNTGGHQRNLAFVDQRRQDAPTADDLGLDRDTIHRWRKRLKDELKFLAELEKAQERCVKITEFQQGGADTKSVHRAAFMACF